MHKYYQRRLNDAKQVRKKILFLQIFSKSIWIKVRADNVHKASWPCFNGFIWE